MIHLLILIIILLFKIIESSFSKFTSARMKFLSFTKMSERRKKVCKSTQQICREMCFDCRRKYDEDLTILQTIATSSKSLLKESEIHRRAFIEKRVESFETF